MNARAPVELMNNVLYVCKKNCPKITMFGTRFVSFGINLTLMKLFEIFFFVGSENFSNSW